MARDLGKATQDFLPIKEIRDGVVVLADSTMRMVLMTSSLNFALKSRDEQLAIIQEYQSFLNGLDFPVQIFVQSRKLDIRPYLSILENRLKEQVNDLIKVQTTEYIEFIRSFMDATNVMSKSLFIVVPYDPPIYTKQKGLFRSLFPSRVDRRAPLLVEDFDAHKSQLEQRASVIEQGLARIGIRVVQLGTEELVELYFKIFNPGEQSAPRVAA